LVGFVYGKSFPALIRR